MKSNLSLLSRSKEDFAVERGIDCRPGMLLETLPKAHANGKRADGQIPGSFSFSPC